MIESPAKTVIDTEYREYAMYVLEQRAIPSCIDGLKPTARKLVCAGLDHAKTKIKVAELGGMLSRYEYHHGEISAQSTLVVMAQDWSNNMPIFEGYGNFGSRLIQEAAAARYIFVKMSDNFKKYFRDFEVCDPHYIKDNPEPQCYLPLIPWVLVNGVKGIAVGFATDILPRDPKALKTVVMNKLKNKTAKCPDPSFKGFNGEIVKLTDSSWQTRGIVEHVSRNTYLISELPWGYDREGYFNVLTKLEDEGKLDDFEDECDDSGFKFRIKINSNFKDKANSDLHAFLKLTKNHNENITTLDEHGKLKLFSNPDEVIDYFIQYRLKKVKDKIDFDIAAELKSNSWLVAKKNFIIHFADDNIQAYTKQRFGEVAAEYTDNQEFIDKLLRIPFYELSSDSIEQLVKLIEDSNIEINRLKGLEPEKVYLKQLEEL